MLTIVLVNARVDCVAVTVKSDIADAETLPISKQAHEILSDLTTPNMEAESLIGRLDMQESRQPVHLYLGRASAWRRIGFRTKIEARQYG